MNRPLTGQHIIGSRQLAKPHRLQISNEPLNAAAAAALSIMTKSLSCRLRPDAEKFAAPESRHSLKPPE
jgi:hypothetical protein